MESAVLVLDVQNGVFGDGSNLPDADVVVQNINRLTERAREELDLVVYIQHEAPGMVEYGSDRWQLYAGLCAQETDLRVRKSTPDAFLATDLDQLLQDAGVKHLIIAGYASDFCIDRTTFSAACRGYSVSLVEDGHTTQDKGGLSSKQIRDHHNMILSMHPKVTLVTAQNIYSDE